MNNTSLTAFVSIWTGAFILFFGGLSFFIYAFLKAKTIHQKELLRQQKNHIHALELRLQRKEVENALKTVRSGFSQIKEHEPSVEKINEIEDTIEEELRTIKDGIQEP